MFTKRYLQNILLAFQEIEANDGNYPHGIECLFTLANQYSRYNIEREEFDKIMKMSLFDIQKEIMRKD